MIPAVLKAILSDFIQVNDPYILERLFAVAYGCCMRNFDRKQIREFALATYEWIFSNDDPPPHILLRDYARNIIELAIQSGINSDIDIEKIRPPYQSEWPLFEIPSEDYFKDAPLNRPILPSEEFSWEYLKLSGLIQENTQVYLQDVYDHTIQVIDTVETFRDIVTSMLDIYLSMVSNRMNEVMKVLTIMATIFIPLTFIAGIYVMNFEFMPELKWPQGYPVFWIIVIAMGTAMVLYFKRKKWL